MVGKYSMEQLSTYHPFLQAEKQHALIVKAGASPWTGPLLVSETQTTWWPWVSRSWKIISRLMLTKHHHIQCLCQNKATGFHWHESYRLGLGVQHNLSTCSSNTVVLPHWQGVVLSPRLLQENSKVLDCPKDRTQAHIPSNPSICKEVPCTSISQNKLGWKYISYNWIIQALKNISVRFI